MLAQFVRGGGARVIPRGAVVDQALIARTAAIRREAHAVMSCDTGTGEQRTGKAEGTGVEEEK